MWQTWIEGPFSQPTWNHYQTERSRTNNHLEGWHNKLKKRVGVAHPTIYKMSDEFKKEQAANEVKIEQYSDGGRWTKSCMERWYSDIQLNFQYLRN
jgi:hypothetical protein